MIICRVDFFPWWWWSWCILPREVSTSQNPGASRCHECLGQSEVLQWREGLWFHRLQLAKREGTSGTSFLEGDGMETGYKWMAWVGWFNLVIWDDPKRLTFFQTQNFLPRFVPGYRSEVEQAQMSSFTLRTKPGLFQVQWTENGWITCPPEAHDLIFGNCHVRSEACLLWFQSPAEEKGSYQHLYRAFSNSLMKRHHLEFYKL